jgi:hypothetical protein
MISNAKTSLPKKKKKEKKKRDHSAPLHALDDYTLVFVPFIFLFSLSLSLPFLFVLFDFNDIMRSNYTFKSNFHFFTRIWYNHYRKDVPFSLYIGKQY